MTEQVVKGHSFRTCGGCLGVVIERGAIRKLSAVEPTSHPILSESVTATESQDAKVLPCPSCDKSMLSFAFAGGNTRAEGCEPCGHVFFERGELAAVLREMRDGIALSQEAQQQLHAYRVTSSARRILSAETAMFLAAVTGLWLFFLLVEDDTNDVPWTLAPAMAATVALSAVLYLRLRAARTLKTETARLERLMEYHDWRLYAPKPVVQRRCPFCKTALTEASTHCDACDSDFG